MIKLQTNRVIGHLLLVAAASLATTGCVQDNGPDPCRDHYLVHADHADSIGHLAMNLTADGRLTKELRVSNAFAGVELGNDAFGLQADSECSSADVIVRRIAGGLVATFESECGEGNRLRQLDVSVFHLLPDLEEVEVTVSTPVTQKRFVISRQCNSPIFRLD